MLRRGSLDPHPAPGRPWVGGPTGRPRHAVAREEACCDGCWVLRDVGPSRVALTCVGAFADFGFRDAGLRAREVID